PPASMDAPPAALAGTFQSKINSIGPYFFSVARSALPAALRCPSLAFHSSFSVFHPVRSMPLKMLSCPSHTLATSSGFGLVLGNSLILRFLKWHSAPSLSRARYPFLGRLSLIPDTSLPLTCSLMTPSLATTL